jgi:hypothetical protein
MSSNSYISALIAIEEWESRPGMKVRVQNAAEATAQRNGLSINRQPDLILPVNPGQYKLVWWDVR